MRSPARLPFDERGGLIVLIDPGRSTADDAFAIASRAADAGACGFLVGDSLGAGDRVSEHVAAIRAGSGGAPVVQFPASAADLNADVDAVLFLVLVSGRNPRYLIEEQLAAVPFFERHAHVAAVSTAYVLIDGGRVSSVERVTGTRSTELTRPPSIRTYAVLTAATCAWRSKNGTAASCSSTR